MTPTTLLWLVTGCLMLQPLSTDLYLASLPNLASDFATTPAAVQHTLSLFVIGFGSAQLVSGPLSDRYGRRPVLIGGLTLYLVASVACALAPSLAWLVAARFAQAIGCCTGVVVARAIIRDAYSPAEGARVLAKASSLLSLAPLLGPILGGYLQVAFGWRAAFIALTIAGLIVWIAALRRMRESNSQPDGDALLPGRLGRSYCDVGRSPAFWAYALPGTLSYASIFAFISGTPFVLIRVLGVPTQHYGYYFALGVFGYLGGTLLCRRMIGRIGLQRSLEVGTIIGLTGGLGFLAMVLGGFGSAALVVGAQFVIMVAHGINFPCAQAGSLAPFPEKAGAAAGLFGFISMLGAFFTGMWVGSSHDGTLLPLASISATVGVILFASARILMRYDKAA
ncbi:MAG: multidrug effflux MFS transporter [Betaproteobacteria bacterium]|nr:multidrug effflux MFS transporter [Betaproteobacteria bacterium]